MEKMKRTVTCGELTGNEIGKKVILNGWVHRKRDHGGIQFINLRDRYGITQIVIDPEAEESLKNKVKLLKFEYCIAVEGIVRKRPEQMVNKEMPTGEIEVKAVKIEVLTECDVLPFMIDEVAEAREDLRLKYRYLDLRSSSMQRKMKLRHDVAFNARKYLASQNFLEIETPTLIKSTPEGARDFLVPSRLHPGKFYALPQSPQLFKQILMVSGFDRYFQIAHCYRDEDARGDRQLEHTQIDIEMSFVSKEDIFVVVEGMLKYIFKETLDTDIATPFNKLSYEAAKNQYGTDKPDLRFDLAIKDFSRFVPLGDFQVFRSVLEKKGTVKALVAPGCGNYSRKMITELEEAAKVYGAQGLAWMKVTDAGFEGGIARFYESKAKEIIDSLKAHPGDLILLLGDEAWETACNSMGAVRAKLGADLKLANPKEFHFCWIIDFPLFEWNKEENKWDPAHHMFTMPQEQSIENLEKDPGIVRGDLYDLVCNGFELASGSIRIHDPKLQQRIFNILDISEKEAERRFGFLLEAFKYGPPPHGGIAPGLDRLVMIMAGEKTIREVIAFPKNTLGISPMDDSPSAVDKKQLEELHIKLNLPEMQA
ncbi:MAG: aspartate--tRNA ligase [Spirochaetota bacterium]